jgi:predicted CopG family antitoxin
MARYKLIAVSKENYDNLRKFGSFQDSFDDVITKILNKINNSISSTPGCGNPSENSN